MADQHLCPRRAENPMGAAARLPDHDTWTKRAGQRTCSYCGSMHPDDFLDQWEAGGTVGPTDKDYKAYFDADGVHSKFYFQHLDEEQRHRFIDLYNSVADANRIRETRQPEVEIVVNVPGPKVGFPGHFYRLPFFVKVGP